ncbi:hypothetical protein EC973_002577 [Apophysomyces ossiformis]|uniref:Uncharacterized protein n=1 Tax=Apophysomyces ossiformis TaxID=679940 RepID=A0A8H7BGL2_9FUNG|nr:hypothetical protein EC973_002577 [Apophysomyces ossiformis]
MQQWLENALESSTLSALSTGNKSIAYSIRPITSGASLDQLQKQTYTPSVILSSRSPAVIKKKMASMQIRKLRLNAQVNNYQWETKWQKCIRVMLQRKSLKVCLKALKTKNGRLRQRLSVLESERNAAKAKERRDQARVIALEAELARLTQGVSADVHRTCDDERHDLP